MNLKKLKDHVNVLALELYPHLPPQSPLREFIEDRLWKLVEYAMQVQQQICGGHK